MSDSITFLCLHYPVRFILHPNICRGFTYRIGGASCVSCGTVGLERPTPGISREGCVRRASSNIATRSSAFGQWARTPRVKTLNHLGRVTSFVHTSGDFVCTCHRKVGTLNRPSFNFLYTCRRGSAECCRPVSECHPDLDHVLHVFFCQLRHQSYC
jgi:hypothetical protein